MSTTPTLRDAAQALLDQWDAADEMINVAPLADDYEALRAALTQGAGEAVEPVAHLWRNVIDGRPRVVMPDSIITADASWVVEDSLHTATQLQQAVALERESILDEWSDRMQSDLEHGVRSLNEIAASVFAENYPQLAGFAAAIRAKGTHD